MLQIIREKAQGIIAWTIILLISVTFALWGIDNFRNHGEHGIAAKVDDIKIRWHEVDKLFQSHYNSLAQTNPQALRNMDVQVLRQQARQLLISQAAFKSRSLKSGYFITDKQLTDKIIANENFKKDGKFSVEKYKELLRQVGETPDSFAHTLTTMMLAEQAQLGLLKSNFALSGEVDKAIALWTQTRSFGYVVVPASHFYRSVQIGQQQIKDYYQQHQHLFVAPEKVKISYINLNLDRFAEAIEVEEEKLQDYYQQHKEFYHESEAVRVRHLFINAPVGSSLVKSGEAKAKIEDLLAQIKLGGDFVALAQKHSEDPGSVNNGGDLGLKGRGETVVEFEEAAFALQKSGDISEVVQTEFGYHIIQLLERKEHRLKEYVEVRAQVSQHYRREYAENHFEDKAEELANLAFETPSSLLEVANIANLKVETSDYFSSKGGAGITNEQAVIDATFSKEMLAKNKNSSLLKLDEENYVILRVVEHKVSAQQSLDEVKSEIEQKLMQIEAIKKADEVGSGVLASLEAGESPYRLMPKHNLEWINNEKVSSASVKVNPEILQQVFALAKPSSSKSTNKGFTLANGDHVVISLSKVESEAVDKDDKETAALKKEQVRTQLAIFLTNIEFQLYHDSIIKRADVNLKQMPT